MFQIKFRIVDDFEELKKVTAIEFNHDYNKISGCFQICFGNQEEGGFYHENELHEEEYGDELLDYWFDCLLDILNILSSKSNYTAFRVIDTCNRWIEFKQVEDSIVINTAIEGSEKCNGLVITKPWHAFSYPNPSNDTISFQELKNTILYETKRFLSELENLNSQLIDTKMVIGLKSKIVELE